jgi:hypothetical protein
MSLHLSASVAKKINNQEGKMKMSKVAIQNVEVGSQIKIGGRVYQITRKVTNVGAFGDYVQICLYDIARDYFVEDQTFQSDAKVFVVFKSSGQKW